MQRAISWLCACALGFAAALAYAQGYHHPQGPNTARDPKRPVPGPNLNAPAPVGPINVPTYSPSIGAYPSNPINSPALTPGHPHTDPHRHHGAPIGFSGSGPFGGTGHAAQLAYYCPYFGAYYPHVTHCPSQWIPVSTGQAGSPSRFGR